MTDGGSDAVVPGMAPGFVCQPVKRETAATAATTALKRVENNRSSVGKHSKIVGDDIGLGNTSPGLRVEGQWGKDAARSTALYLHSFTTATGSLDHPHHRYRPRTITGTLTTDKANQDIAPKC